MALNMNQKEFDNWTETRVQGAVKYSVRTSLFSTIVVFLLYFIGNGFVHLENIDKYIAYNLSQSDKLAVTLLITFITLLVASRVVFAVNEKRYKETQNKK